MRKFRVDVRTENVVSGVSFFKKQTLLHLELYNSKYG
jgi:hypothetical protein